MSGPALLRRSDRGLSQGSGCAAASRSIVSLSARPWWLRRCDSCLPCRKQCPLFTNHCDYSHPRFRICRVKQQDSTLRSSVSLSYMSPGQLLLRSPLGRLDRAASGLTRQVCRESVLQTRRHHHTKPALSEINTRDIDMMDPNHLSYRRYITAHVSTHTMQVPHSSTLRVISTVSDPGRGQLPVS